ncbi:MAG TPA: amino acid adenylation domain-containing protein, partial [Candidatus Deferrimicrobium sp.]|nr:amino acid adenylation domain-containing protein [Candidatus Deferrimicrobium sp.]
MPGDIVAVMMEPSVERVIALLGILKSGAAYLPVDPLCPQERLDYMLKDSNVKILINKSEIRIGHSGALSSFVLNFENLNFDIASNFELRAANLIPTNLSYIIYTSGSTGRPKGVAASHRNVLAYLTAFANEFHLNESDIVIQQASYTFDAFVEEMYPVLLKGGKLAVPRRETVKDIHLLAEFIARYKVSMITCSPLLLAQLNNLDSHESLSSIHTFISGGDVLHGHFIEKLLRIGNVYNTYGPTESTVCITYYRCSQVIMGKVPIGKPIANYKAYILDRNLRPVPQGIPGELCVAGPGVAQGYLNNPELTAEKFIIHHSKFYKTGDLARWLEDGNIEFLGRKDQQVKIRGFRIELEEIESHLRRHEEIRDAVVIAVGEESADKFLCAYIVSDKPWEAAALETYLAEVLPDYMIPRNFTPIERIPVTTNGKVDRKTLPPPGKVGTGVSYTAPRNNIEEKLVAIWADVLAKNTSPAIGIDDDFFKLGGHSLNAAMVISKIHKILNVKIPLVDLFHQSTIRQLAEVIRASAQNRLSAVAAVEEKDYYTLSSAQERLYILQQMEPSNTTYNIPHMLKLEGVIDNEKLTQVFKELIRRHESFRTSFVTVADEPVQRVRREVDFAVEYLEGKADKIHHFIRAFDLAKAPLLRVGLVKLAEQEHILILDMHHIIADGASMGILTAEAMALYSNEKLPPPGVRYRDYSAWQRNWKKSPSFKEQETFWRWQFEGEIPVLNLPSDWPRPKVQHFEGRSVFFELEKDITS